MVELPREHEITYINCEAEIMVCLVWDNIKLVGAFFGAVFFFLIRIENKATALASGSVSWCIIPYTERLWV